MLFLHIIRQIFQMSLHNGKMLGGFVNKIQRVFVDTFNNAFNLAPLAGIPVHANKRSFKPGTI